MKIRKFSGLTTCVFILATLSSCSARVPWTRVQTANPPFYYIGYEHRTRTIWMATAFDSAIYRLQRPDGDLGFGKAQKIVTPSASHITGLCASNGVWITSYVSSGPPPISFVPGTPTLPPGSVDKPESREIYVYLNDAQAWQMISPTTKGAICKTLKSGRVVFRGQDLFISPASTSTQLQNIKIRAGWRIGDVTDDSEGNLWISTAEGDIYRQSGDDWILVDAFPAGSQLVLFIDNSKNLWAAVDNKYIYKYSDASSIPSRQKVFESSLGFEQNFFQDNSGAIWILTNDKLLVQKGGMLQEVGLPPRAEVLHDGFFDSETNALFVSTEMGVFVLDLDSLNN